MENVPCGEVFLDPAQERPQTDPMGHVVALSDPIFRFSDVVAAIATTPKSFRRWLITLGLAPKEGWHAFSALDVIRFGIMREMVNWGVSVKDAYAMSGDCLDRLLRLRDDPEFLAQYPRPGPEQQVCPERHAILMLFLASIGRVVSLGNAGEGVEAIFHSAGRERFSWDSLETGAMPSASIIGLALKSYVSIDVLGVMLPIIGALRLLDGVEIEQALQAGAAAND